MDEVPMIDDFDVRIPMMSTNPEISAVDICKNWMILILDETPSLTINYRFAIYINNINSIHSPSQSTASPLMSGANINKKIPRKDTFKICRSGWNVVDESAQSPLETSITSHVNFESLTIRSNRSVTAAQITFTSSFKDRTIIVFVISSRRVFDNIVKIH